MDIPTEAVCSAVRAAGRLVRLYTAPLEQLTEAEKEQRSSQESTDALFGIIDQGLHASAHIEAEAEALPEHFRGRAITSRVRDVLHYWVSPPVPGCRAGLMRDLPKLQEFDGLIARIQEEAGEAVADKPQVTKKRKPPHNKGKRTELTRMLYNLFQQGKSNDQILEEVPSATKDQVRTARGRYNRAVQSSKREET